MLEQLQSWLLSAECKKKISFDAEIELKFLTLAQRIDTVSRVTVYDTLLLGQLLSLMLCVECKTKFSSDAWIE